VSSKKGGGGLKGIKSAFGRVGTEIWAYLPGAGGRKRKRLYAANNLGERKGTAILYIQSCSCNEP